MKSTYSRPRGARCCADALRRAVPAAEARRICRLLRAIANPVRLALLDLLARNPGRVCVCDLEAAVPVKQPTVSHHLMRLRQAGLVEAERRGPWMHYRVRPNAMRLVRDRLGAWFDIERKNDEP
jgi:ArsR family transcriptional regulator